MSDLANKADSSEIGEIQSEIEWAMLILPNFNLHTVDGSQYATKRYRSAEVPVNKPNST